MKALILVAGQSVRMGSITESVPKTLLEVGGRAILDRLVNALASSGIEEFIFVDGYLRQQIRSYFHESFPELKAVWVENDEYASSNTAYSVHLTREHLLQHPDDVLLLNGDVVLDERVIAATLASPGGTVLAARFDRVDEEEVKFRLDGSGRMIEIGKHINPQEAAGESLGINRLGADLLPKLFDTLERRIAEGDGRMEYYEHAFNELIQNGAAFYTADVTHLPVMEIDTPEDYEYVQQHIGKKLRG